METKLETRHKWSNIENIIGAAPESVRQEMDTWPAKTQKLQDVDKDGKETTTNIEGFATPYGFKTGYELKALFNILVSATKRNLYKKFGRSKYVPHQGTKETKRRIAQGLTT